MARGGVTETAQRNRCSAEWMIVVEVGEENIGSILCPLSSVHFIAFSVFCV